jgi:antitoxin YefM
MSRNVPRLPNPKRPARGVPRTARDGPQGCSAGPGRGRSRQAFQLSDGWPLVALPIPFSERPKALTKQLPWLYNTPVHFGRRSRMATKVSYSYARQNLASLLDQAEDDQEPVYISRRNREEMVLLPAAEYRSVEETAHLLRSPENARRLLRALQRALESGVAPSTIDELRTEVGLEETEG